MASYKKKNLKDETKFCSKTFVNLYSKIEHELTITKEWPIITMNNTEMYNIPKKSGFSNLAFDDAIFSETTKL